MGPITGKEVTPNDLEKKRKASRSRKKRQVMLESMVRPPPETSGGQLKAPELNNEES